MKAQIFTMVPASSGPIWFLVGISVLFVVLLTLFAWLAWASRHTAFEVSDDGLKISGTLYGRLIPASSLVVTGARVLDLRRERQYRPRWRTNGAGLPGYQAGWFKLNNGEKSLLFVTNKEKVVYVPTTDGYSVMVSTRRPEELRAALQSLAP